MPYSEDEMYNISYTVHSAYDDEPSAEAILEKLFSKKMSQNEYQLLLFSINRLAYHLLESAQSTKDEMESKIFLTSADVALQPIRTKYLLRTDWVYRLMCSSKNGLPMWIHCHGRCQSRR